MFRKKLVMDVKFKYRNHRSSRTKTVRKIYVTCSEKYSYLCEVQALVPQKFNNTAVRKKIHVTFLDSHTTRCEVQLLVQHKFTISTKKNQVSFF